MINQTDGQTDRQVRPALWMQLHFTLHTHTLTGLHVHTRKQWEWSSVVTGQTGSSFISLQLHVLLYFHILRLSVYRLVCEHVFCALCCRGWCHSTERACMQRSLCDPFLTSSTPKASCTSCHTQVVARLSNRIWTWVDMTSVSPGSVLLCVSVCVCLSVYDLVGYKNDAVKPGHTAKRRKPKHGQTPCPRTWA